MGKEIEMKDAETTEAEAQRKPDDGALKASEGDSAGPAPRSVADRLRDNVALIDKAVRLKETRVGLGRLLRQTAAARPLLNPEALNAFVQEVLPAGLPARSTLLGFLSKAEGQMDTDNAAAAAPSADVNGAAPAGVLPEVEAYAYLLVILYLIDAKLHTEAKELSTAAVKRLGSFNRRTLDVIAARVVFYYSYAHELTGCLADIRGTLLALHRTAVLRHDEVAQETLLNLLLRNYLHYNLYDQAEKLRSKAQRPEQPRSQQQYCRYLYYLGRIRAIQLDYTDAKDCLQQAARKAPNAALGFRVEVAKWLVLVRLLLGEIPERTEFSVAGMATLLAPYFQLTQAVRIGDLTVFRKLAEQHDAVFRADRTVNLIVRLRHNVIRTGLRRINLAYSRISLPDVASRLGLSSAEDTECIVAKAIRDGGIEAVIDHSQGWLQSKEVVDVYSTEEPQTAFHARVAFCLDIHNEAVKAMRFEAGAHRKALEGEEARKERLAQEAELAKEISEEEAE